MICIKGVQRKYLKPNRKSRQSIEINSVKTNAVRKKVIIFSATYCPTLPKYQRIINKHWHILNINDIFENQRQIIGGNTIRHNKKLLMVKQNANLCNPCTKSQCLSCQQIPSTTTFGNTQTKKQFDLIYIKVFCKSNYNIYLQY